MSVVVADTSGWVEFFAGREVPALERALSDAAVVLPPVVVAELLSGARRGRDQIAIADLLRSIPLHPTPFAHWIRVGNLRRTMRSKGLSVSTPDAHVAQCALDRHGVLLLRDRIFAKMTRLCALRVGS